MNNNKGKATIIFGGQAGSEAKGKVAGYYALRGQFEASISNFMPNAGHTWIGKLDGDAEESKVMVQTLPQALINKNMHLILSAGSAIELKLLVTEVDKYNVDVTKISIDPRAVIVTPQHAQQEKEDMGYISSTQKGCGEALADKAKRSQDVVLWGDIVGFTEAGSKHISDLNSRGLLNAMEMEILGNIIHESITQRSQVVANGILSMGGDLLIEAPQGYDLDINHGVQFPYCTSRQTTPAQAVADAGIPMQSVDKVIAVIRPYPIRVGNQLDDKGNLVGTSGEYHTDEISWKEIAKRSGMPIEEISERTTVTNKIRRVFEPNIEELKEMVATTGATHFALNFANYIDYSVQGATKVLELTDKVLAFINNIELATGIQVIYLGTGAKDEEAIEFTGSNRIMLDHHISKLRNRTNAPIDW